jgi:hypothetical protein
VWRVREWSPAWGLDAVKAGISAVDRNGRERNGELERARPQTRCTPCVRRFAAFGKTHQNQ